MVTESSYKPLQHKPSQTVLMTGGTGLIGRALSQSLAIRGYRVYVLTRGSSRRQNRHQHTASRKNSSGKNPSEQNLSAHSSSHNTLTVQTVLSLDEIPVAVDIIVNLAGEPIDKQRWSDSFKQTLVQSRVDITERLYRWAKAQKTPPSLIVSASAVGCYGAQGDNLLTEDSQAIDCFSRRLCVAWEAAARQFATLTTRVCIVRIGVVFSPFAGAFPKLAKPIKWGVGGRIGDGSQYISWIHIDDLVQVFIHLFEKSEASGVYNATAPNPVCNSELTAKLSLALRRPALLHLPALMVRFMFGEMAEELLLKGQRVIPQRLLDSGFLFACPDVEDAITLCLSSRE